MNEFTNLKSPIDIKVEDCFSFKANKIGNVLMYFNVYGEWLKTHINNVYYVLSMKQNY